MRPALILMLLVLPFGVASEGESGRQGEPAAVEVLARSVLSSAPEIELIMFTVEYEPGARSAPHLHEGDVFVYVLEGSLVMQMDGEEALELGPGDVFLEKPGDVHRQSANASDTRPARFLVVISKRKDDAVTKPLTSRSGG